MFLQNRNICDTGHAQCIDILGIVLVAFNGEYRASIMNWWFFRLHSCLCISRDTCRHGFNSNFWFTIKMLKSGSLDPELNILPLELCA